jgi:peptidoglycan/LPS O-acetylase OafA/YrhL
LLKGFVRYMWSQFIFLAARVTHRMLPSYRFLAMDMRTLQDILKPADNNFSFIRLIAAALVVVGHAVIATNKGQLYFPFLNLRSYDVGGYAVNVFFVLSGLMIAASLDRTDGLGQFAAARFARLMPAVFAYAIFAALLVGPVMTTLPLGQYFRDPHLSRYFLRTIGLLDSHATLPGAFASFPDESQLNSSMWTLKFEIACYIGLAVFSWLKLLDSNNRFFLLLSACLTIFAAILLLRPEARTGYGSAGHIVRFGICFLFGVCAYRWRSKMPLTALVLIPLLALLLLPLPATMRFIVEYFALGYLAFYIAGLPMPVARNFTNRYDLSYGTYIYGWIWLLIVATFAPKISPLALALIALPLTLCTAGLSWLLVEEPSLKFLKARRAVAGQNAYLGGAPGSTTPE